MRGLISVKGWRARHGLNVPEEANKQAGLNPTDHYEDVSIFPYAKKTGGLIKIKAGSLQSKDGGAPPLASASVFLGQGGGDIKMESMANEVMRRAFPLSAL